MRIVGVSHGRAVREISVPVLIVARVVALAQVHAEGVPDWQDAGPSPTAGRQLVRTTDPQWWINLEEAHANRG